MPIAPKFVQSGDFGSIFGAVSAVATSGAFTGNLVAPWQKGQSGNPSGKPKLLRAPSVALAELNDTPGSTLEEQVENFKAARGEKFCAADLKAIAAFKRDLAEAAYGVAAFDSTTDRLDGKGPPELSEAEIVEETGK